MNAFVAAAHGYNRELHRFLMRRLRHPQDVDDLAQEVYERILRIDEEKTIKKPLAYLYGIASHVLADFRIEEEIERNVIRDELSEATDSDGNAIRGCGDNFYVLPDDMEDRLNLQQQIDKAMAQLPPTHAAVLLAHKRDGLSYEETAEKLGLSVFTVEKYMCQAKARVRTMSWDR